MTKEDHVLLAKTILRSKESIFEGSYQSLVADFCEALAEENPDFNQVEFLEACKQPAIDKVY